MNRYEVLKIVVDTNDGDYYSHIVKLEGKCPTEVQQFLDTLQYLPVEEGYYFWEGERKSCGNKIFWNHDRVGKMLDYEECALKAMIITDEQFEEEDWTMAELREEGGITEAEYGLLCKFLPMYCNEGFGFHTIVSVSKEIHTEPEVTFTYNI